MHEREPAALKLRLETLLGLPADALDAAGVLDAATCAGLLLRLGIDFSALDIKRLLGGVADAQRALPDSLDTADRLQRLLDARDTDGLVGLVLQVDALSAGSTLLGHPEWVAGLARLVLGLSTGFSEEWSALGPVARHLLQGSPPASQDPMLAVWRHLATLPGWDNYEDGSTADASDGRR